MSTAWRVALAVVPLAAAVWLTLVVWRLAVGRMVRRGIAAAVIAVALSSSTPSVLLALSVPMPPWLPLACALLSLLASGAMVAQAYRRCQRAARGVSIALAALIVADDHGRHAHEPGA